ncbi:MAG: TIGR04150 pseudo-rSAM protein [Bacteroidales bacterium]|jgi:pseudo-rSAM protein|nr:TIGR04150 pseudo-rSAM protein [Bacteroidales bacterium]
MIDKNRSYWVIISNKVYYTNKNGRALLYNTENGQYIITSNKMHISVLEDMHRKQALGVVKLGEQELLNNDIYNFLCDAVNKDIFKYVDTEQYPTRPIQLMPILSLHKEVEKLTKRDGRLLGLNAGKQLLSAVLYLNNECVLQCEYCGVYNRQFLHCGKTENGGEMDFDLLKSILNQLRSTQIQTLHITGANIFKYGKFERLANLLKEYRFNVNIYFHLSNYNIKSVSLLKDFKHNIFIHFPLSPLDNDVLKNIAVDNIIFHFVITSDNDYAQSQQIIEQYNLSNTVFHPFFTGENIIFFEENTFLSENDILESEVKQKTIFANQKLNSNFYGTLHFCSDGNVFSNPNAEPLENIKNMPLLDLIYKEMIENTSWRKIRNEKPCSDCNYQYLCPPVSNYETAIGRPNLCTVF